MKATWAKVRKAAKANQFKGDVGYCYVGYDSYDRECLFDNNGWVLTRKPDVAAKWFVDIGAH